MGSGIPKRRRVRRKRRQRERAMVKKLVEKKLIKTVRLRDFRVEWAFGVDLTVADEDGSNDWTHPPPRRVLPR